MKRILAPLMLVLITIGAHAQTCCSGGVPISGSLALSNGAKGSFQALVSYDHNLIDDLYEGTTPMTDGNRVRKTQSALAEINYNITDRIAVSGLFSFVRQVRDIKQFDESWNTTTAAGLGDGLILLKYQVVTGSFNWLIGIGAKAPLGRTDHVNELGILLPAEMQPGTGAWDLAGWTNMRYNLPFRPSMNVVHITTYRNTGTNEDYYPDQDYRFGNVLTSFLGLTDKLMIGSQLFDLGLMCKYRHTEPDELSEQVIPATGGDWIFIVPSLGWFVTPNLQIRASADLPVYAKVTGTQLITSNRFNAGIWFNIGGNETTELTP